MIHVGVLGGEEEHKVYGYVWQSDHAGIKASWVASDHESGVTGVRWAVGTANGIEKCLNLLVYHSCSLH